jgi:hypothetical protein
MSEQEDRIETLKRKHAGLHEKLFPKKGLFRIEEGKPETFFVLADEYSSKGLWYHPVGVHYIKGKLIVSAEVAGGEVGSCFIFERIREMRAGGSPESEVFPYLAPEKYAMNILVQGEEVPRLWVVPTRVGLDIIHAWEDRMEEKPSVNIFDPFESTAYTVTLSKEAGRTQYTVVAAATPAPIVTGDNVEEKISRILRAGANLDYQFRVPALQDQRDAWANR